MSTPNALQKILKHPDKDEIISKLILGISAKDIHEWLAAKYTNVGESKFVVAEKSLKSFCQNYLDVYNAIKEDLGQAKASLALSPEDEAILSVQNNPTYKSRLFELAGQEIDIKKMLSNMIVAVETRVGNYFDVIQEDPRNLNSKQDRVMIELMDTLGVNLERFHKIVNGAPDQVIQHNVTVQHIDQHVQILQEAIRETLSEMDVETSLRFMEVMNEKLSKVKPPTEKEQTTEVRLAEAKILNETINKKLNGVDNE